MAIHVGDLAPAFTLADQQGTMHRLADYRGRWVLLYFYPKDMTPGCTVEACTIRDAYTQFQQRRIVVLGVSTDTSVSHKKFSEKYELPFPLLADVNKEVVHSYGVWGKKKFMGRAYMGTSRMSFLIDPNGRIARVYEEVKPAEHADAVLADHAAVQ